METDKDIVKTLWPDFITKHAAEITELVANLYDVEVGPGAKNTILFSYKTETGAGRMYICPTDFYKSHAGDMVPVDDLIDVGHFLVDWSEPEIVYALDDFDKSII